MGFSRWNPYTSVEALPWVSSRGSEIFKWIGMLSNLIWKSHPLCATFCLNLQPSSGKIHFGLILPLWNANMGGVAGWGWNSNEIANRGFSRDVISSQFCKSSYSRPPCWFPVAWTGIGKYNKMSRYFLFSSNHYTKLRPSDKNIKTHTRLGIQILL